MPSDEIRVGPGKRKTFSSSDHLRVFRLRQFDAPWGAAHEEMWKLVKKSRLLFGDVYLDRLGLSSESRRRFRGPRSVRILASSTSPVFPKILTTFIRVNGPTRRCCTYLPHWNWKQGEKVDVVAYFNNADEVELFLNGRSEGTKRKQGDDMHVFWRLAFEPGRVESGIAKERHKS
jgi:beta-galactosidase